MNRFLVDEDLPRGITKLAIAAGIDATHVIDSGLRGRPDADVLAWAIAEKRTLVTADLEFANILAYPPSTHLGVILVRIAEEVGPDGRMQRIVESMATLANEDMRGGIAVVEPGRIRMRLRPRT